MAWLAPLAVAILVTSAYGDCPPRQHADWERGERASLLSGYDKYNMRCPVVNIGLYPDQLQVDSDLGHASLDLGIHLMWTDPALVREGSNTEIKVNSSEIWTPRVTSVTRGESSLTPSLLTSEYLEVLPSTGIVSSYFATTLRGLCQPHDATAWPRDKLFCTFIIWPAPNEGFNVTQHFNLMATAFMQRMSSWRVLSLSSSLFPARTVLVQAELQRLPAQLEAVAVQPGALVAALVPASAALPPASTERPTLLVAALLLHAATLLALPGLLGDIAGAEPPRNLLLFRDIGLLLVLVVVQWLVALRLSSRRRPLSSWLQAVARTLAVLRRPLLLQDLPAPPGAPGDHGECDEQSVGLAEVLDRLTFLAAAAAYLALVTIALH